MADNSQLSETLSYLTEFVNNNPKYLPWLQCRLEEIAQLLDNVPPEIEAKATKLYEAVRRKNLNTFGWPREDVAKVWDKVYPGEGERIAGIVAYFFSEDFTFPLQKKPDPKKQAELDDLACRAIWFYPVAGALCLPVSECRGSIVRTNLKDWLCRHTNFGFYDNPWHKHFEDLKELLIMLASKREQRLPRPTIGYYRWGTLEDNLELVLAQVIVRMLQEDQHVEHMKLLLEFWMHGYPLYGINKDAKLVAICDDG